MLNVATLQFSCILYRIDVLMAAAVNQCVCVVFNYYPNGFALSVFVLFFFCSPNPFSMLYFAVLYRKRANHE